MNNPVVDRPGVPADLYDRYWWTGQDAGQVGTTAQIGLPDGERVVTAASGVVISARWTGGQPNAGTVDLLVRDIRTGTTLRSIATSLSEADAVLVDGRLFWTGLLLSASGGATDGGVWTAELNPGGAPKAIVKPGQPIAAALAGRSLELSSTGRTLAAVSGGYGDQWTDVIDVASSTRRTRLAGVAPIAITDDIYVTDDQGPTDAPYWGYGITARDRSTAAVKWRYPARDQVDRFVLRNIQPLGSNLVMQYEWKTGEAVELVTARVDPETGRASTLLREADAGIPEPLGMHVELSSPQHLWLARGDDLEILLGSGRANISTLDLSSGNLTEDAFTIELPFL